MKPKTTEGKGIKCKHDFSGGGLFNSRTGETLLKCNICGDEKVTQTKTTEGKGIKLDYKKMLCEIEKLVETDFCFDMDSRALPHSKPYTQEEADKMARIIGQVYLVSHCVSCTACQGRYKVFNHPTHH